MKKSATEVMQEIVYAAVLDGIGALKSASKGLPNTLLRDLNAIHPNTTFADLPPELQAAIQASVRAAFARLLKEGYSVSPGQAAPQRPPHASREGAGSDRRDRRPAPSRGAEGPGGRGPRRGGPGGKPGGGGRPSGGGRPGGGRSGPK